MNGLLLVDKPAGVTSHSVVSKIRQLTGISRVGHLGTLDPFATGLLPVMIGGANRLADQMMGGNKAYEFDVQFGQQTTTLDPTGEIMAEMTVPKNLGALIESKLPHFMGKISQVPPVYSALKVQGRPMYEHMRSSGKLPIDIEEKRRDIHIYGISVLQILSESRVKMGVFCGKGTYVRCLARDLAIAIGTVGHCVALRRTFVEPWYVNHALTLESLTLDSIEKNLLPLDKLLPKTPYVTLVNHYSQLANGNIFSVTESLNLQNGLCLISGGDQIYLCEAVMQETGFFQIRPQKKLN